MKTIKKILFLLIVVLLIANLFIIISGKQYLYKGIKNTYLLGRSGPSIDEYEIFPSREIANDINNIHVWRDHPQKNKFELSKLDLELLKNYRTTAFLIIQRDSVIVESYLENTDVFTISNSFSVAKSFVGALIGAAIKDGYIESVNQKVSDFIPEIKNTTNSELLIKHLLTMSSGINFDEDYANPFAYPAASYYGEDLENLTFGYQVTEKPGEVFKYLSGNSELLGILLTRATNKKLAHYASEKLWKPLGAEQNAKWNLDKEEGMEKSFCCLISSARDFAKLGSLYMNYGNWKGVQLIDSNYIAASIKPATYLINEEGQNIDYYGFHWWMLNHKGFEVFYARGILGQYIFCIPELDIIAVRLGHKRDKKQTKHHPDDVYKYLDIVLSTSENFKL